MFKQTSIVWALLLFVFFAFGISNTMNFNAARQSLVSITQDELMPLVSGAALQDIEATLENTLRSVAFMPEDRQLKAWVENGETELDFIQDYLASASQRFGFESTFFVSDQTKHYYYHGGYLRTVDESLSMDAWYFQFKREGYQHDIDVDYDEANEKQMTLFVNYRLVADDGRFLGVIGAGFSLRGVVDKLQRFQREFGTTVFTIDQQGFIQLHPEEGQVFADERQQLRNALRDRPGLRAISAEILRDQRHYSSYKVNILGQNTIVAASFIPSINWYLIAEQPEPAGVKRLTSLLVLNSVLAAVTAVVVAVMVIFLRRSLTEKIRYVRDHDSLGGVKSRQYFEVNFDKVCSRLNGEALYFVMIDVDDYRRFCIQYGRQEGETMLLRTLRLLRSALPSDIDVTRLSTDQFGLLISDVSRGELESLLDDIQYAIFTEYETQERYCTATIVAVPVTWGMEYDRMLHIADKLVDELRAEGAEHVAVAD